MFERDVGIEDECQDDKKRDGGGGSAPRLSARRNTSADGSILEDREILNVDLK